MLHPLKQLIIDNRNGIHTGVCSVCSSNEFVIEAAMEEAKKYNSLLLVEATANQVNQFGGYTGMEPKMFRTYVKNIAQRVDYPADKIILGGDHLGPLTWKNENAETAMEKAKVLVEKFAEAGFSKIHIDTSMKLADDPEGKLSSEVIAKRGAELCKVVEETVKKNNIDRPVYIIGSEVPIPGGAQTKEELSVTTPDDLEETVKFFETAFKKQGLDDAWKNVIAYVVQPGVEFGSDTVHEYNRSEAKELIAALDKYPGICFEGHSTDYQTCKSLTELCDDHIAILKVGPALTFALREGLFSLEMIEKELIDESDRSNFSEILEKAMLEKPGNWKDHYKYGEKKNRIARKFSYSDRCRYYFDDDVVKKAIDTLLHNLSEVEIPMSLISQFFPEAYWKVRDGSESLDPRELAKSRIKLTLDNYYKAVTQK